MNSVRITYIAAMTVGQMIMMAGAVLIPVYITPGYYYWSAFLLGCVMGDGYMMGKRMNLWEGEV